MKALYLLPITITLAACATSVTQDRSAWTSFAYEGFGNKIERLAGAEANHCGVINQVSKSDPINKGASVKQGRACVIKSITEDKPFKFGTVRIPIDSYLFEALVYTPEKEYWIVHYDVMLDGTDNMHIIKRCKGIDLKRSESTFEGIDCVDVPTNQWLADIPEQQK